MSNESADGASRGSSWADRRVLVTGASGFIGQHVLGQLLAEGASPVAVARNPPSSVLTPELEPSAGAVTWRQVDLRDAQATRSLLETEGPECVIHLAGMVTGSREREIVLPMLQSNLLSAVALMDAAVEVGCRRFVQAGSLEEPESAAEPMASPYAAAKAGASLYARLYRDHYGLETASARIFMVYGPGPQDENKLVPYVVRHLLAGRPVELSGGSRAVDWVYVEDVARGLLSLAASEAHGAELGSGALHTVREVAESLRDLLAPEAELLFGARTDRANERVRRAELTSNVGLNWSPSVSLKDGLARTVEWMRSG